MTPEDQETARQVREMRLLLRHPYLRYQCEHPGCEAIYDHPRILGSLRDTWYCPDHDPFSPLRDIT